MDLGTFRWISWIPGVEGLPTCGALKSRVAAPKERLQTPILQVWRLGGLDAWMPGGLEAAGLDPGALEAGWLACWLAGRLGLDWIGLAAT